MERPAPKGLIIFYMIVALFFLALSIFSITHTNKVAQNYNSTKATIISIENLEKVKGSKTGDYRADITLNFNNKEYLLKEERISFDLEFLFNYDEIDIYYNENEVLLVENINSLNSSGITVFITGLIMMILALLIYKRDYQNKKEG